ncbi:MAG: DUF4062 domain-containing protein [Prevotella sp.]|nr:DUF4062 domain-containing protein [Prevotella sp.]
MSSRATTWRTFPVFISSTFKDMDAERDMLKSAIIFPFYSFCKMAAAINSAAFSFSPPPITSISACWREGSINSSCMGRTVL